jgi:uncharacterized protein
MKSWVSGFVLLVIAGVGALNAPTASGHQRQDSAPQVPGTPITIGEVVRIKSRRSGEDREIQIYLPASYANSRQRFPVIYALDGEGTGLVVANSVRFMTGYSTIPQMPEVIVVAVTNTDRNRDMPVPQQYGKGGEDNFLAYLADELIPAIEQRYRTQPLRILTGHSQGGLFANYALTARPTVFQWYLLMDAPLAGFLDVKPLMDKTRTVITKNPNYHGRLVTIENLYGWGKEWASLAGAAPKGFYGEQVEIKNESHETMVYLGIYEGLKRLFHDYAPNIIRDNKKIYTLPALDDRYKALSQAYGYQVDIPKQLLLTSASQNLAMQYGTEAVELVKRAVALYGESATTKRLMTEAAEAVKKGRDPRFEEWANLPPPDIETMKPFLGTWEGVKNNANWVMTFQLKDGAVHAQNSVTPPNGETFHLEVQFVRVIDRQTVQWGLRNGLGGGTILQTAKLVNENTLQGTSEPVGIPHAPPPHAFTYKRRSDDKKQ